MGVPTQLITQEFAVTLNRNYISQRSQVITNAIGYEDTNSIWYSIAELENYLEYVKNEAGSLGLVADGIRFYFGVYPDDPVYGDKAKMTNLFLSPTGYEEGGTPASFDLEDISPMNSGGWGTPPIIDYPLL